MRDCGVETVVMMSFEPSLSKRILPRPSPFGKGEGYFMGGHSVLLNKILGVGSPFLGFSPIECVKVAVLLT